MTTAENSGVASLLHEVILDLFRRSPRDLLEGLEVPWCPWSPRDPVHFEADDGSFSRAPIDADLILAVRGPDGECRCVLIIEVQLSVDARKHRSWPSYQADAHRRYGCPAYLIVVTLDPAVAAWAAGPISTGQTVLRPLVIGPREVPVVDRSRSRDTLELTLLSGLAHCDRPVATKIGEVLWHVLERSGIETADLYWDLFLGEVDETTRQILMQRFQGYGPQSEWGWRHYHRGQAHGQREGRAAALIDLLEARGWVVEAEHRRRITTCEDPARLRAWLQQAVGAPSLDDVFLE